MRRFKFIGNPEEYQWEVKPLFMMTYDHEYLKYYGAENLVENYPEDWQEVFEDESGWISVGDRLPEEGNEVLVYSGDCCWIASLEGNGWRVGEFEAYSLTEVFFTHWTPLPKPPVK